MTVLKQLSKMMTRKSADGQYGQVFLDRGGGCECKARWLQFLEKPQGGLPRGQLKGESLGLVVQAEEKTSIKEHCWGNSYPR